MSYLNIFLNASLSIKVIIVGLMLASVWSWTIIFQKFFQVSRMRQKFKRFEELFWGGESIKDLYDALQKKKYDLVYGIFIAGMEEWSAEKANPDTRLERIDNIMSAQLDHSINSMMTGMSFLSNLGRNGVIIGLFGTVLGIAHVQASATQQAIGMGISETLYVTAVGLIAAIPAAIAYDKIIADITLYENNVQSFIKEFKTIVARQS